MSDVITPDLLQAMICDLVPVMYDNMAYLNQLDAAIGDGDHGRNMALGFQSVLERLQPTSLDLLLRSTGMTMATRVGGASGPLYGAAFIAAGMSVQSQSVLTLTDVARIMSAATEALARRGRCRLNDKTILDALEPAVQALREAAADNCALLYGLQAAAFAAHHGMEATIPMIAKRGLAMQYGAAAIGHQDPGATSCYLIFDSFARTVERSRRKAR